MRAAPLLVIVAAVLWGTSGAAQELGAADAAPWTVAAVRTAGGGALLALAASARGRWPTLVAACRRRPAASLSVVAAMTAFQMGYLGGISAVGVAIGTLVAIGTAPVFTGVIAWLRGRRPGRRWITATTLTVLGVGALVVPDAASGADIGGFALAVGAGVAYASYTTVSKELLEAGLDGLGTVTLGVGGTGLLLAPLLIVGDLGWLARGDGLTAGVWLAVGTAAVAYLLFVAGLAGVDAPTAATLTLAEPLTATVLGVVAVGERPGPWQVAGVVAVVAGLVLAGGPPPRARREP